MSLLSLISLQTRLQNKIFNQVNSNNLISLFFIFSALVFTQKIQAGGSTVGNGGDLVECQNPVSQVKEYKSLDYLLTLRSPADTDQLTVHTLVESLSLIQNLLNKKIPELAPSFQNFVKFLWNESLSNPIVWEQTAFGIIPISDEEIGSAHRVPDYCRNDNKKEKSISLIQAVIRLKERFSKTDAKRFYAYNPGLIRFVEKSDPLQISFLLVHEWLWDFSTNVERNRRINRLFHSPSFHSLSSENIKSQFQSLGFVLPDKTEALFESQFCQSTPSSIDELLQKKDKFFIGRYQAFRRSRSCFDVSGCGSYNKIDEDPFSGGFSSGFVQPFFNTKNIIKIYGESSVRSHPATSCELNRKGEITCMAFRDEDGYSYNGEKIVFKGTISSECTHLKFSVNYQQNNGLWTETQFVLWSQFTE